MTPESAGAPTPVVLFDLDNTLFDRAGTYRIWATSYCEARGLDAHEVDWLCRADDDGYAPRALLWSRAKERWGLTGSTDQLVAQYHSAFMEHLEPDTAVHRSLRALRDGGWGIGVVTNGHERFQLDKAMALGIAPLVDGFCSSGELGIAKPDPEIFAVALARCAQALPARRAEARWMVGDSAEADVLGAHAFGVRSIWLRRGRSWNHALGAPPTVSVASLDEAVRSILDDLGTEAVPRDA
jgi:putative hydrolase of the HAD superfamily